MVLRRSYRRHAEPEEDLDDSVEAPRVSENDEDAADSACSTPYVSAPSSPGRTSAPSHPAYFFSAPASPVHFVLLSAPSSACRQQLSSEYVSSSKHDSSQIDFEFGSRFSGTVSSDGAGSMSSADELFLNGQIRPMKLSSHLKRPQVLSPLIDLEEEDGDDEDEGDDEPTARRGRDLKLRSRSVHRKARSLSPLRNEKLKWNKDEEICNREDEHGAGSVRFVDEEFGDSKRDEIEPSIEITPSCSAPSSRSSSSGRNSKKWIFLTDLLYRSKSEGRGNGKEKFWSSISLSLLKDKKLRSSSEENRDTISDENNVGATDTQRPTQKHKQAAAKRSPMSGKPTNGVAKRRVPPSAHELHYTANRAQAEEMKKKTHLPYRNGLFGCLGFSSKGYGALNGLAKSFNPVSSR